MGASAASVVVLTIDELRTVVRDAVREAAGRDEASEVLTTEQAGEVLQISRPALMKLVHELGLPAHRLGPREWRFLRSEIIAWVVKQKKEGL